MAISSFAESAVKETAQQLFGQNRLKEESKDYKLLNFYEDMQVSEEYLGSWGFKGDKTGKYKIPLSCLNITKFIIDKISLLYKKPPDRKMYLPGDRETAEGDQDKNEEAIQNWISYNPSFNVYMKYAERYKNLMHKILFRPFINPMKKEWQFFIETYFRPHFWELDPRNPYAYSIKMDRNMEEFKADKIDQEWWLYMSPNEMFFYQPATGKKKTDFRTATGKPMDYNGVNPYGILPFVEMRKRPPITQWGSAGAIDLVDTNQQINVAINTIHLAIQYQSFGIIYKKGKQEDDSETIKISPFVVNEVDLEESLESITLNPDFINAFNAVEKHVQAIAKIYGVNLNFAIEASPVSGVSLMIQNIDLLENRENDIDLAIMQENSIFNVIRTMQKIHKSELPKNEIILPDKYMVSLDFKEMDFPVNIDDKLKEKEFNLKYNLTNPIRMMMEKNPDLTKEKAEEELAENIETNSRYRNQRLGIFNITEPTEGATNEQT